VFAFYIWDYFFWVSIHNVCINSSNTELLGNDEKNYTLRENVLLNYSSSQIHALDLFVYFSIALDNPR